MVIVKLKSVVSLSNDSVRCKLGLGGRGCVSRHNVEPCRNMGSLLAIHRDEDEQNYKNNKLVSTEQKAVSVKLKLQNHLNMVSWDVNLVLLGQFHCIFV